MGYRVENHWGRSEMSTEDKAWTGWYRGMEKAGKNLSPPFKCQRHHVPRMLSRVHGSEIALSGSAAVWVVPPCCLCMSQRKDLEQTCCQEKDREKTVSQAKSFMCLWPWTPLSNIATAQIMRTSYPNTLPSCEMWLDLTSESNLFLINLHLRLAPQLLVLV